MRKRLLVVMVVALLALGPASPAFAIVHAVTPSNECGASDEAGGRQAVLKGGIGADNNPAGVAPPVPANNPGQSTGTGVGEFVPEACES